MTESYAEPTPTAHFFREAMVEHDASCNLRRSDARQVCTCRAGPPSGFRDVPMEGPSLVLRRFDEDRASTGREAELEAENEALRARLRALAGGDGGGGTVVAAGVPAVPPSRHGVRRIGR